MLFHDFLFLQDLALCPECKRVCNEDGAPRCSDCGRKYHEDCRGSGDSGGPAGDSWTCERCLCSPLKAIPDKIITWRWKQPELDEDDEDEPLSGTFEQMFCKSSLF